MFEKKKKVEQEKKKAINCIPIAHHDLHFIFLDNVLIVD